MNIGIFDDRQCTLGEGPIWHPLRKQFYWFDIEEKQFQTKQDGEQKVWQFDRSIAAAAWIDQDHFAIADEFGLVKFNLNNGSEERIVDIEKDNPVTRANDSRADPFGGFWIGTMGKNAEEGAGGIHRYYRGEVRCLFPNITIPNSICFSPDGLFAYFTDTGTKKIMRQSLDQQHGWPVGDSIVHIDLNAAGLNPDGSVVDAAGNLWNAQWGGNRVSQYSADGELSRAIELPASQITCPAFGGEDLQTMIVTSANINLGDTETDGGKTFVVETDVKGQLEHQLVL